MKFPTAQTLKQIASLLEMQLRWRCGFSGPGNERDTCSGAG